MTKEKQSSIYPWVVVGLLWMVAFLNYMDRQMLSTMRVPMMGDIAELEMAANFGRLMAVFLWIYGLMSPLSGIIADRVSRKWLIVGSLGVWSAVTCMMGFATTFNQLYFLRGLMGVSEALYLPAGLAMIADFHRDRSRSLAVGIHMTGLYAGQAVGGFGATIAAMLSWHHTFMLFGLIGVVYAVVLALALKDVPRDPSPKAASKVKLPVGQSLAILLTNISFWVILFYFCIPSIPGWAVKNWLPTLFSESLGVDMSVAGPIATISIAASSLVGVLLGGRLSDWWVMRNVRGRVFTGAIGLTLIIPALMFIGYGGSLIPAISGAMLFGIGFGMFDANNMPILCQFVPSRQRATAYGIMNMCGVFAGAVITATLGRASDAGHLGRDFAMMAIVVLAMVVVQVVFLRPKTIDMKD
jgi:MFS family permease